MQQPTLLVVLVNGLWGFQKDWRMMQQSLEAENKEGILLMHVSGVNTGDMTYHGIDVCGARLAEEVLQVVSSHPSLTTISLMGHSMGGLIARYALGLLANPKTCKVAGLSPGHFISIASPHLGCSSNHPEELSWQDRPWMRWLAAAVREGYLGGSVAAAATAGAAAAAALEGAVETQQDQQLGQIHDSSHTDAQPMGMSKSAHNSSRSRSSSSSSNHAHNTQNNSHDVNNVGKAWPWTPCRSVIQLLGCDAWHGPAAAPDSSSSSHSSCCKFAEKTQPDNCRGSSTGKEGGSISHTASRSSSTGSLVIHACGCCSYSSSDRCQHQGSNSSDSSNSTNTDGSIIKGNGSSLGEIHSCDHTGSNVHLQPLPGARCCCSNCGKCSRFTVRGSAADTVAGQPGAVQPTAVQLPLLDHMAHDVLLRCSSCGAVHTCYFLSGLRLFKYRSTYSSAGGDHLIPWASSSLLFPQQLPTRHGQLPAAALWTRQPAIVEWPQPALQEANPAAAAAATAAATPAAAAAAPAAAAAEDLEATQQPAEQQQLDDTQQGQPAGGSRGGDGRTAGSSSSTSVVLSRSTEEQQQCQFTPAAAAAAVDPAAARQHTQHTNTNSTASSGGGGAAGACDGRESAESRPASDAPAAVAGGVLSARLLCLQSVGAWQRFHVVWPRLCLGSSHCNIQYNGPINFVGKAVVEHVVRNLTTQG